MPKKNNLINISKDPFFLFKKWFDEACKTELNDPNAMNLSTVSEDFKPSSRMVLLKNFDVNGFVFYTNINSKKGKSILKNPNVALNFHWKSILRQIRIEGKISEVSDKESNDYFDTRHVESRIGAWASKQSSVLKNRKNLKDNLNFYKEKFKNQDILRPPHWRGLRVEPNLIEFWQDMPFRLHDRVEYTKIKNNWVVKKLYP